MAGESEDRLCTHFAEPGAASPSQPPQQSPSRRSHPLGALGTANAAETIPPATHGIDFDYFKDAYPGVGANSVFETVTLERFKYLLRDKSGNFAFVIGDPNDANTQATIGYINEVAKQLGISKIYNFSPKIDGGKWNLWNWNDLATVTGGNALTYWKNEGPTGTTAGNPGSYYSTHTDDYLNKDTHPEFVRTDGVINGPYLFVYNKDRQIDVSGTPTDDHIVSSLADRKTADRPGHRRPRSTPTRRRSRACSARSPLRATPPTRRSTSGRTRRTVGTTRRTPMPASTAATS